MLETLADQIYEKFLSKTYFIQGDFCEDEISTLILKLIIK